MRLDELDRAEARLNATIAVLERDPILRRSKRATLRRLRGLRWAMRIVRARLVRRAVVAAQPRLDWRSQGA